MQPFIVLGAGVRGRIIVDIVAWQFRDKYQVAGFYDDRFDGAETMIHGTPLKGSIESGLAVAKQNNYPVFIAFGTKASHVSCQFLLRLKREGVKTISLISPGAHVSPSARFGTNCLVMPGVFVGPNVTIGDLFCAHGNAVVEHDCTLGNNVLLGPGVSLASKITIKDHVFLGAGASVIPEMIIGEGCMIGAGSTVVRNVENYVVATGSPARSIRQTNENDEVPSRSKIKLIS